MRVSTVLRLGVLSSLLAAAQAASAPADVPPTDAHVVECAFSNPGYSGLCRVSETVPRDVDAGSACRVVLSCLNDQACTKSYCNATTIRSGWVLVKAKVQRPSGPKPASRGHE